LTPGSDSHVCGGADSADAPCFHKPIMSWTSRGRTAKSAQSIPKSTTDQALWVEFPIQTALPVQAERLDSALVTRVSPRIGRNANPDAAINSLQQDMVGVTANGFTGSMDEKGSGAPDNGTSIRRHGSRAVFRRVLVRTVVLQFVGVGRHSGLHQDDPRRPPGRVLQHLSGPASENRSAGLAPSRRSPGTRFRGVRPSGRSLRVLEGASRESLDRRRSSVVTTQ
jgi:hypothetical protein